MFGHGNNDLLEAVLPYLPPEMHSSFHLFIKTFEFMDALRDFRSPKQKAEYFKQQSKIDFEAMLKDIRPHCTKEEAGIIDLFLNMMSAANFYKTYQQMASMFAASQASQASQTSEASEAPKEAQDGCTGGYEEDSSYVQNSQNAGGLKPNPEMMDTLMGMLPPEQKGMFEMLKTMMESGMLNQMFSADT